MRLLHTSDWHLGRSLHRADLRDAQAAFIDHLVEVVQVEKVDVVLVAGDVYDRAVPPLDAVALCESAFVRIREAGAKVVVISGNHDSARRLGFGSALIDASGVFLRTDLALVDQPVVIDDVPFFGIPYLEPAAVGVRSHVEALTGALDRIGKNAEAVVLAHCWVAGGVASDSERDITVGGVGAVPLSLFDGYAYTALGHLHGAQVLHDRLRYSGSPLAYSFSEAAHVKGSWLVELGGETRFIPAPVPRRLSRLHGTLSDLLTDPAYDGQQADWLAVTLTDTARPELAMEQLTRRFPHVLVLTHEPAGVRRTDATYASRVSGRSDLQVAASFVEHVRGSAASPDELTLLTDAFDAVRVAAG